MSHCCDVFFLSHESPQAQNWCMFSYRKRQRLRSVAMRRLGWCSENEDHTTQWHCAMFLFIITLKKDFHHFDVKELCRNTPQNRMCSSNVLELISTGGLLRRHQLCLRWVLKPVLILQGQWVATEPAPTAFRLGFFLKV